MALERGADAEGDDRHAMLGADPHDLLHLVGVFRKGHAVRRLRGNVGGGMRMLLAHRLPGLEALAEPLLQDAEHAAMPASLRSTASEVAESHGFLRDWTIVHAV